MTNPDPKKLAAIRLVVFDVDGVFTDGRFYLADDGTETKAFNTQDGYGVRRLLGAGIAVAVISGRRSGAVERRMKELGVAHVFQGCGDKVHVFEGLLADLQLEADSAAYVGDDIPDLHLLQCVALPIAVANAVPEVKKACAWVTTAAGGFGAVREVCELILGGSTDDYPPAS